MADAGRIKVLAREIRNLAHNAWTDPKNAEYLFREIEKRAELLAASPEAASPQEEVDDDVSGEAVASTAYMILGVLDHERNCVPVRILDYFAAVAHGGKPANPLPFNPDEVPEAYPQDSLARIRSILACPTDPYKALGEIAFICQGEAASPSATTPTKENLERLLIETVTLAIMRHNLQVEGEDEDLSLERAREIAQDTAWAMQGEGTCDETPAPEWTACIPEAQSSRSEASPSQPAPPQRGDSTVGRTVDEERRPLVCFVCGKRFGITFNFCLEHKDEYEKLALVAGGESQWVSGWEAGREAAAGRADLWAKSISCTHHDENPCCHVRTGAGIAMSIRELPAPPSAPPTEKEEK